MKNMKVSMKLIAGFLIVVMLTVLVGSTGIYGLTSMGSAAEIMYSQKALPLGHLADAMKSFQRCRVLARDCILYTGNAEKLPGIEQDINDQVAQFETEMNDFKPTITTEEGRKLFESIMSNFADFKSQLLRVLDGAKQGKTQGSLLNMMDSTKEATNSIETDLTDIISLRMDVMAAANEENFTLERTLLITIIVIVVLSSIVSIVLALYISGLISKPISLLSSFMSKAGTTGDITLRPEDVENIKKCSMVRDEVGECIGSCARFVERLLDISKAIEKVSDGDLTSELRLLSDSDTMGLSLSKMVVNLNSMLAEVNGATVQMAVGTKHVSEGSQSLAQGSTQQAAAVQQLSSSISEVAVKTKENADLADHASELAVTIRQSAEKGSKQMDEMLVAVREIQEASSSISKVIKVIDDIAFQTNILALNAAVEAARAGQHGKGFAVVAEEVRNLAAKSATAAKDTGSLISNSMEKAELGAHIAAETAVSLAEIVIGINESGQIIGDIARSSEEQAAAIGQINSGIDQVAQVVYQNSATAEESASASEEMNQQANILEGLVEQFKIKGAYAGSAPVIKGASNQTAATEKAPTTLAYNNRIGKY